MTLKWYILNVTSKKIVTESTKLISSKEDK